MTSTYNVGRSRLGAYRYLCRGGSSSAPTGGGGLTLDGCVNGGWGQARSHGGARGAQPPLEKFEPPPRLPALTFYRYRY